MVTDPLFQKNFSARVRVRVRVRVRDIVRVRVGVGVGVIGIMLGGVPV